VRSDRFWLLVLGAVVIVSAIIALLFLQEPASYAYIYKNGVLTETVSLNAVTGPYTITVEDSLGTNVIEVERGCVRMLQADCPDGTCVRQGWVSGAATPIVCLPHRLVITFESGSQDIDAVVG